jgi:hypothetical protein
MINCSLARNLGAARLGGVCVWSHKLRLQAGCLSGLPSSEGLTGAGGSISKIISTQPTGQWPQSFLRLGTAFVPLCRGTWLKSDWVVTPLMSILDTLSYLQHPMEAWPALFRMGEDCAQHEASSQGSLVTLGSSRLLVLPSESSFLFHEL